MSAQKRTREHVLELIRRATEAVAADPAHLAEKHAAISRSYIRKGGLSETEKNALLMQRLREYDADVAECEPEDLLQSIHTVLSASSRHTFAAPPELPATWMSPDFNWVIDHGLSHEEIEKLDGVVTASSCAIADSGTIVLHHSPTEGRRVLTLLPDWHLCIVKASQVVETLPEYFAGVQSPPARVTWISGPSATADIEMTRIKGVHGPRYLKVILVHD
jgi:L-lactate dehydrogenase complex protein LldG